MWKSTSMVCTRDAKYTSSACGIAFLGALAALNAYLLKKRISMVQLPESVEAYNARIKEIRNSQIPIEKGFICLLYAL